MNADYEPPSDLRVDDDAYRQRINQLIHLLVLVTITPVAIYRWFEGDHLLAVVLGLGVLYLATALLRGWAHRYYTVSASTMLVVMAIAAVYASTFIGILGVLWVYPLVIGVFFIFEHALAVLFAAVVAILSLIAAIGQIELQVMIRMAATFALCIAMAYVFASRVAVQREQLIALAMHDGLTDCFNRTELNRTLRNLAALNARHRQVASLVMLDIDHFKHVNDSLGHIAGDTVLRDFAELMQSRLRRTDAMFRYGGEEFAILLPETPLAKASDVAEQLRSVVENHDFGAAGKVTISAGVAELQSGEDWGKWLDRSDSLMYKAKKAGRNRVVHD